MTNYEIWKALAVAIDSDESDGIFSPKDYNEIAREVNISLLENEMESLYAKYNGRQLTPAILSSKLLRGLLIRQTGLAPTAGVLAISSLSSTYGYWVSMTAVYNGQIREIKLISQEEFTMRNANLMMPSIKIMPVATIDEGNLRVFPTDLTSITFSYIKIPANPVFDYYSDSNDRVVYMAAGATGVSIPSGATYSDGTAGPTTKNSTSVEWAYDTTYHNRIYSEMLRALSNRLKDQNTAQYSEMKKNKEDSI